MTETPKRKLHPIVEGIIFLGMILVSQAIITAIYGILSTGRDVLTIKTMSSVQTILRSLCPIIFSPICFKLIAKRKLQIWKILLTALGFTVIFWLIQSLFTNISIYFAASGIAPHTFTIIKIISIIFTTMNAASTTLIVHIWDKHTKQ